MDHIDYRAPKPFRRTLKRSCTPKHHLNNATFAHSEPACRTDLLPVVHPGGIKGSAGRPILLGNTETSQSRQRLSSGAPPKINKSQRLILGPSSTEAAPRPARTAWAGRRWIVLTFREHASGLERLDLTVEPLVLRAHPPRNPGS